MRIEHVLRICKNCRLVYGNGWLLCPVCGHDTEHYMDAYSEVQMNRDAEGNEYTFKPPDDWGTITGALVPGVNGKVDYAKIDPESGKLKIVVEEPVIKRVQFTAYDRFLYPEIDNDEYLEHEICHSRNRTQMCSYGWIEIDTVNDGYRWVKKVDVPK